MSTTQVIVKAQPTATVLETITTSLDRVGYLFGQKITHSWSPLLHQVVYDHLDLKWVQIRLDSADIPSFLELTKQPQFYGASVTMPNKVAILPYLDDMTEECRDVGACNTIFLVEKDGQRRICGTNTDVIGIRDSFYHNVSDPATVFHDRPALVIGGGGAARSAIYALRKWMRVTDIYLVNRDAEEVAVMIKDCTARGYGNGLRHLATLEQARAAETPGAIVACVPDFAPHTEEEKLARAITVTLLEGGISESAPAAKGAMLEMCYNPTPFTQLGALAQDKGWQVILGTEALIWQGLEQDKYWTGKDTRELPVEEVQSTIAEKIRQRDQSRL